MIFNVVLRLMGLIIFCEYVSTLPIEHVLHEYNHEHHLIKTTPIPIIKHEFHQHHKGYQFNYETGNGIHVQEAGYLKNKGDTKHEYIVQHGTVTYHDEHGHPITLTYVADENGFQPHGAHLPTPPPIPEGIQKTLHNDDDDGSELNTYEQQYEAHYHNEDVEEQQQHPQEQQSNNEHY